MYNYCRYLADRSSWLPLLLVSTLREGERERETVTQDISLFLPKKSMKIFQFSNEKGKMIDLISFV